MPKTPEGSSSELRALAVTLEALHCSFTSQNIAQDAFPKCLGLARLGDSSIEL